RTIKPCTNAPGMESPRPCDDLVFSSAVWARPWPPKGLRGLLGLIPFAERLFDIARGAHERFQQRCQHEEVLVQIEAAAQAPGTEVKDEVQQALVEIQAQTWVNPETASQLTNPIVQKTLTAYLEQIPATIRATLRRPGDPSGRTLPRNFSVKR